MLIRLAAVVVAAGMLLLVGCSDEAPPVVQQHTDGLPASTRSSPPPVLTPTAPPEMVVAGKRYPLAYGTCGQELWDGRVDEWNRLVQAGDTRYADQPAYFKAKGWPTTFPATLDDAATRKACG